MMPGQGSRPAAGHKTGAGPYKQANHVFRREEKAKTQHRAARKAAVDTRIAKTQREVQNTAQR